MGKAFTGNPKMKHSYIVTAALLGVLPPNLYILYLIAVQGYAWLVEPNPVVLYGEFAFVAGVRL